MFKCLSSIANILMCEVLMCGLAYQESSVGPLTGQAGWLTKYGLKFLTQPTAALGSGAQLNYYR